jgi:3-hydroxyacyl-CoA dehydrogenase
MLGPLLGSALQLVASGVARPQDVERAWMKE